MASLLKFIPRSLVLRQQHVRRPLSVPKIAAVATHGQARSSEEYGNHEASPKPFSEIPGQVKARRGLATCVASCVSLACRRVHC